MGRPKEDDPAAAKSGYSPNGITWSSLRAWTCTLIAPSPSGRTRTLPSSTFVSQGNNGSFSETMPTRNFTDEANCVSDMMHVMSGADFIRWEPFAGTFSPFSGCFFPSWENIGTGPEYHMPSFTWAHLCYNVTARVLGRLPGLMLPPYVWRPLITMSEANPLFHFILACPLELNSSKCRHATVTSGEVHKQRFWSLNRIPPDQLLVKTVPDWKRQRLVEAVRNRTPSDPLLLEVLERKDAYRDYHLRSVMQGTYRGSFERPAGLAVAQKSQKVVSGTPPSLGHG